MTAKVWNKSHCLKSSVLLFQFIWIQFNEISEGMLRLGFIKCPSLFQVFSAVSTDPSLLNTRIVARLPLGAPIFTGSPTDFRHGLLTNPVTVIGAPSLRKYRKCIKVASSKAMGYTTYYAVITVTFRAELLRHLWIMQRATAVHTLWRLNAI